MKKAEAAKRDRDGGNEEERKALIQRIVELLNRASTGDLRLVLITTTGILKR